ncbi:MAG: hypothetical protein ACJ768_09450 [Gaiellaceae bacterium]
MSRPDELADASPVAGDDESRVDGDRPGTALSGEGPRSRPGIYYQDRVLVLASTGGGKSTLLNVLFSTAYRCQRFLLDTKDEWRIDGVPPVTKLADIDWTQPVIHYVDDTGTKDDHDRLFKTLLARRQGRVPGPKRYGLVVCVHELADLCGDNPGSTPVNVSGYLRKGRAHGQGLLGASQRPVNLPKAAKTEAQHYFVMAGELDADDRQVIAKALRLTESQLDAELERARALAPDPSLADYAYLWYDRPARRLTAWPPLPPHMLARSFVHAL